MLKVQKDCPSARQGKPDTSDRDITSSGTEEDFEKYLDMIKLLLDKIDVNSVNVGG